MKTRTVLTIIGVFTLVNSFAHFPDSTRNNKDSNYYSYQNDFIRNPDLESLPFNQLTDNKFINRFSELEYDCPFPLTYNEYVKPFIRLYLEDKQDLTQRVLNLSRYYYPMIEEIFDKHNIPLELKHLAVVESALNPNARSRVGATGMWQFMYNTGKQYGLKINSVCDERKDPVKSTEAAARYLKDLHNRFGDWMLALAAYNSGPGNVNKAIRHSGGKKTFWEIRRYLPRETRGYIPAFIAVNYVMSYFPYHDFEHPTDTLPNYFSIDTIMNTHQIKFTTLSKFLDIEFETIGQLNPSYRLHYFPASNTPYPIYLPEGLTVEYIDAKDAILAFESTQKIEYKPVPQPDKITYRVRYGDALSTIARRHGVTVSQLKSWNGLSSSRIKVGQRLAIYGKGSAAPKAAQKPKPKIVIPPGSETYTVKPGDTLWDIARSQGISVRSLQDVNPGINFRKIKPGQKIIIPKS